MKTVPSLDFGTHQRAKGRVRVQVVDSKTGRIKRDYGWKNNLILNQGMENIGTARSWAASFTHAVAGTGTTPTQDDSGATVAEQTGTTVTLSGGSFTFTNTATDEGKMIKWDTNEEARVVTVTSATEVEVDRSQSVSSNTFTVFRTNQLGLATEVKRSNTYVPGSGNCGTTYTPAEGKMVMRRTYDFSSETGSVSYTEVGFAHVATVANNLYSRILLPAPVALIADDQFRVIYELTIVLGYYSPQAITPTITGWSNTEGSEMIEMFGLHAVNDTGTTNSASQRVNDVVTTSGTRFFYSDSTTALSTEPTDANVTNRNGSVRYSQLVSLMSYTPLSFTRKKTVTILAANGVMSGIRSIAVVYYSGSGSIFYVNVAFLMDNPQEKLITHTLTLRWTYSWSRVLA